MDNINYFKDIFESIHDYKFYKFYFTKSVTDKDGYIIITIPPGSYEIESLNNQIKRIITDEEHYTEYRIY